MGEGLGAFGEHDMYLIIKERKGFPRFSLLKYLIGREQKFQINVSFDWSRIIGPAQSGGRALP